MPILDHEQTWHPGQGNGEGSVFADKGRMRLEAGGTTLYPICSVIDFDGERDANIRIIAAAPELLDFLIQYLWSEHSICDPLHYACCYTPEQLRDKAQALLAKIEGTEP